MTDTQTRIDTSALLGIGTGTASSEKNQSAVGERVMDVVHRMDRFWERDAGARDVAAAAAIVLTVFGIVYFVLAVVY